MASVSLTDVGKTYPGGVEAVRGVTVDIADGEFVVLVGPSGCGKSTTLRMIAGLEEATNGEIRIGDRVVNNVPPAKRDIAMVFQNYALYPHMTVRKNLSFGLRMRKTPKPEISRRIAEVAATLGIEELLDRKPAALSGGQRQRVALGRAIARQPAVFLFDEPLSNLDAKLRGEMRSEIAALHRRLKDQGASSTMIYVTHDQVEAMTLADRLVLMRDGVVQQIGAPLEVYNRPANRFAASFLGSPPMNFFKGEVIAGELHLATESTPPVSLPTTNAPNGPVTLGVRPEDLTPATNDTPVFATASVQSIEHHGHETLAHVLLGEERAISRLPNGVTAHPGDALQLTVRPEGVHLFAADDQGERL